MASQKHKLITPLPIQYGEVTNCPDLITRHEEADVIMVTQMLFAVNEGRENIWVICDDTQVFLLLLHYYSMLKLPCKLMMAGTSKDRALIDTGQTVNNHSTFYDTVLAAHALSGCNTTARMNGIGKGKGVFY